MELFETDLESGGSGSGRRENFAPDFPNFFLSSTNGNETGASCCFDTFSVATFRGSAMR